MADKPTADDSTNPEEQLADLWLDGEGVDVTIETEGRTVSGTVTDTHVEQLEDDVVRRVVELETSVDDVVDVLTLTVDDDGHGPFAPTLEFETSAGWKTDTVSDTVVDVERDETDGDEDDSNSHASRVAEQLRIAEEEADEDEDEGGSVRPVDVLDDADDAVDAYRDDSDDDPEPRTDGGVTARTVSTTYRIDTGAGFTIETRDTDVAEHHSEEGDRVVASSGVE